MVPLVDLLDPLQLAAGSRAGPDAMPLSATRAASPAAPRRCAGRP